MPDEIVTATEASRGFLRLLDRVEAGHSFVVTYHGKPVARIEPVGPDDAMAATRERARQALFDRLSQQPTVTIGPWTRDELYEDEELQCRTGPRPILYNVGQELSEPAPAAKKPSRSCSLPARNRHRPRRTQ